MKSILFSLLLALSFTTAIAEKNTNTGIDESPVLVSFFKKSESNVIANKSGGPNCVRQCFNEYRRCMQNTPGGIIIDYYRCEVQMEQCTTNCLGD
ncbi:MAG: hypothetical protein ACK5L8_02860 [Marinicella pacifica]